MLNLSHVRNGIAQPLSIFDHLIPPMRQLVEDNRVPEIIANPVLRNNLITSVVLLALISALRIGATRLINQQIEDLRLRYAWRKTEPENGPRAERFYGSSTRIHDVGAVYARHTHSETGDDHAERCLDLGLGGHYRQDRAVSPRAARCGPV